MITLVIPRWGALSICVLLSILCASAYFPNNQVQADWQQASSSVPSYIQNKPALQVPQWDSMYNYGAMWYNASGRVYQRMKIWSGEVTPSAATGQTVDVSSAGFTNIIAIHATAYKSGVTYGLDVNATATTTTVSYSLTQPNTTLVSILGNGVLLGNAYEAATTLSNCRVRVVVIGY